MLLLRTLNVDNIDELYDKIMNHNMQYAAKHKFKHKKPIIAAMMDYFREENNIYEGNVQREKRQHANSNTCERKNVRNSSTAVKETASSIFLQKHDPDSKSDGRDFFDILVKVPAASADLYWNELQVGDAEERDLVRCHSNIPVPGLIMMALTADTENTECGHANEFSNFVTYRHIIVQNSKNAGGYGFNLRTAHEACCKSESELNKNKNISACFIHRNYANKSDTTNKDVDDKNSEKHYELIIHSLRVFAVSTAEDGNKARMNLIYVNNELVASVDFMTHGSALPGHWHINRPPPQEATESKNVSTNNISKKKKFLASLDVIEHWGPKGSVFHGNPYKCPWWWLVVPEGVGYVETPVVVKGILRREETIEALTREC